MSKEDFSEVIEDLERRTNNAPKSGEQQHPPKELEKVAEEAAKTLEDSDSSSVSATNEPRTKKARKFSPKNELIMNKYREALTAALNEARLML